MSIKWYLSVQVELVKDGQNGEDTTTSHFRSRNYTLLNSETFNTDHLSEAFQKMFERFEKYIRGSPWWVLKST